MLTKVQIIRPDFSDGLYFNSKRHTGLLLWRGGVSDFAFFGFKAMCIARALHGTSFKRKLAVYYFYRSRHIKIKNNNL